MKTCEEMLRDRGCKHVTRTHDGDEDRPAIQGWGGSTIMDVYVHSGERVGVKFARTCVEGSGRRDVIIVGVPTAFTRKEFEGRVQFFAPGQVCYNVTHHALVPKHTVVASTQFKVDNLPVMKKTDPVAQYYGWDVGTVVRIERVFGGHEPVVFFRLVVP